MSGLSDFDAKIANLEAAAERCAEATREANSATKELGRVEKRIRYLLTTVPEQMFHAALDAANEKESERFLAAYAELREQMLSQMDAEGRRIMLGLREDIGRLDDVIRAADAQIAAIERSSQRVEKSAAIVDRMVRRS